MESLSSSLTNFHSLNFSFLFSKFFQFTVFTDKMAIEAFHVASIGYIWASLVAQTVKCLTAIRETRVQYLGREYPLEEVMATHSSTLALRILWTEEPGGLQSMGSQSQTQLSNFTSLHFYPKTSRRK